MQEVDSAPPLTASDYRIHDEKLSPQRSRNRKVPSLEQQQGQTIGAAASVEDSDLYAAEYFLIQCLGENIRPLTNLNNAEQRGGSGGREATEIDYGVEEGIEDYQAKLTWSEVLLDDFS